jgi:Cu/Ag efflux protein CusF
MKRLLTLAAASIAVLLLVVMPVASQAPQAEKSFSGTLTKVDAEKKVITVKGTGAEPEMTFTFDDKTQVTGAEKTVQGLTGKSGALLKITYREQATERIAT